MDIQQTTVINEINAVLKDGVKPVFHRLEFTVHTPNGDVKPLFVIDMDVDRNYIKNHFDVVTIQGAIPKGQYNYYIQPNKTQLEVTVRRIPLTEARHAVDDFDTEIRTQRFRATLYSDKSGVIEGNDPTVANINKADMTDYVTVRFQLMEEVVHRIRKQSVGGIYHDCTGIDVVRFILTTASKEAKVDSSTAVKGVTIARNSNTEVRNNIIIGHHVRFIDFPYLVNQICGGIYSAGFHYYLQDRYWFVYAPFDITAYHASRKSLTIVNVPNGRFPEPERSYRVTKTQVIVLSTGQTKHNDLSESAQLNTGNGLRFVDANKIMDDFLKVEGNKAVASRTENVSEIMSEPRADNLNHIVESPERITANIFTQYLKLAEKSGAFIQAVWENSNPELIYPGMPVKYMYVENNLSQELYGIVIGTHSFDAATNKGVANRRFGTKTTITLFVQRKVKIGTKDV